MRLITGNNNLAYRPIPKTDAINLLILNNTKGRDLLKFQEYQNTLYQEYELQEAVNTCRVTAIEQVVSTKYIKEKQKEYVGYNNKTIRLLWYKKCWCAPLGAVNFLYYLNILESIEFLFEREFMYAWNRERFSMIWFRVWFKFNIIGLTMSCA